MHRMSSMFLISKESELRILKEYFKQLKFAWDQIDAKWLGTDNLKL
jgi:hypothetical protein